MKERLGPRKHQPEHFTDGKLVAVASGDCCVRCLFALCAGCEQFPANMASRSRLSSSTERLAASFLHAVDDRLLNLGTEFGDRPKVFPPRGYRPGEMLHKVVNSARTTSEMEQKIWTP